MSESTYYLENTHQKKLTSIPSNYDFLKKFYSLIWQPSDTSKINLYLLFPTNIWRKVSTYKS